MAHCFKKHTGLLKQVIKADGYEGRDLVCEIMEAENLEDPLGIHFSQLYKARSVALNPLMGPGDVW